MSSWVIPMFLASAVALAAAGPSAAAELTVLNEKSAYPEGPLYRDGLFYYAEMGSNRVMVWDGVKSRPVWMRPGCGPTSVSAAGGDGLNILCHLEESVARISSSGETLKIIDRDSAGQPFRTPNASINDAKGGVYFSSSGDFAPGAKSIGAVLYLDREDELRRVAEGIHYANGVALAPGGDKLYVSEHLSRNVLLYDVAADGSLSNRRIFVRLGDLVGTDPKRSWEVGPDGLAVDRAGNLFIAEYGGGHFIVVDPRGRLLATVPVPEDYITALALAPDEKHIFVTAPASYLNPLSGKVYWVANPVARAD